MNDKTCCALSVPYTTTYPKKEGQAHTKCENHHCAGKKDTTEEFLEDLFLQHLQKNEKVHAAAHT